MKEDLTEFVGSELLEESLNNKNMQKVKSFFKVIFEWIVWSSANSDKISLTLKAGIPFLVLLGLSDSGTLNQWVGTIGQFIVLVSQSILGLVTAWGLLRKIWYTYKQ